MENELIRRGDAIEALKEDFALIDDLDIDAGMKRACINRAIYKVGLAVAVDAVEVRHARWIEDKYGFKCSACKKRVKASVKPYGAYLSNYCGECGARMDGKEKHNAVD